MSGIPDNIKDYLEFHGATNTEPIINTTKLIEHVKKKLDDAIKGNPALGKIEELVALHTLLTDFHGFTAGKISKPVLTRLLTENLDHIEHGDIQSMSNMYKFGLDHTAEYDKTLSDYDPEKDMDIVEGRGKKKSRRRRRRRRRSTHKKSKKGKKGKK